LTVAVTVMLDRSVDVISDTWIMAAYRWHRTRVIGLILSTYQRRIPNLHVPHFLRTTVLCVWTFCILCMEHGLQWHTSWNREEMRPLRSADHCNVCRWWNFVWNGF